MYYLIVCLCWVASVLAAPTSTDVVPLEKQQPTVIPIVSQSDELEPNGTYRYSYETGNGIKREEISYDKIIPKVRSQSADSNEGGESGSNESDEIHVQKGSYSYTAPDGKLISVRYIADENGFRPVGDHIPRIGGPETASANSGEKSSRALKSSDSSAAESSPAIVAKSKPTPLSAAAPAEQKVDVKPESKFSEEKKPDSPAEASTTEISKYSSETEASTPKAESSTATTELSTVNAESSSAGTDSSTTEANKLSEGTTEASSLEFSKPSFILAPESSSLAPSKTSTTETAIATPAA